MEGSDQEQPPRSVRTTALRSVGPDQDGSARGGGRRRPDRTHPGVSDSEAVGLKAGTHSRDKPAGGGGGTVAHTTCHRLVLMSFRGGGHCPKSR